MTIIFHGDYIPVGELPPRAGHIRIANLECAFANEAISTGKAYTSVLPWEHALMENVGRLNALSVANNHVYDAGNFGEQLEKLEKKFPEVQFFGTVMRPYAEFNFGDRKIAVIGCLERCRSRGPAIFKEEEVLPLLEKLRSGFARIYIYPHWGKEGEYTRYPSPRQIALAHRWIDAGADGVFGSHSHVFQGHETYRGKPVFYSLGNFCFPHPESALYAGTDWGMSVRIDVDRDGAELSFHRFDREGVIRDAAPAEGQEMLAKISPPLENWSYFKWGRRIGGFYIRKNMASWKLRIRKKFPVNLMKFAVWNLMPLTLWMRACSWFPQRNVIDDKTN